MSLTCGLRKNALPQLLNAELLNTLGHHQQFVLQLFHFSVLLKSYFTAERLQNL